MTTGANESETTPSPEDGSTSERPAHAPRFSWPMRVFLFLLIFEIVFRSMSFVAPWDDWAESLDMQEMPRRLPTREEQREIAADPDRSLSNRLGESAGSVGRFLVPWPEPNVRENIDDAGDVGRYAYAWLITRMVFFENLVGVNEDWPMFSPNVSSEKWVTRSRLVFSDGSTREVRQLSDPEDLTHFSRWNCEKVLDHEVKVKPRYTDECVGWCHLLTHRYPESETGSRLERIELFRVNYEWPRPGEDAHAVLAAQNGPPADRIDPVFYVFDVRAHDGEFVE